MELSEALKTIDEMKGFFFWVLIQAETFDKMQEILSIPVLPPTFDSPPNDKFRFVYKKGEGDMQVYIPNIKPVCDFLINDWPSPVASKIRQRLVDERFVRFAATLCFGSYIPGEDPEINMVMDGAYEFANRLDRMNSDEPLILCNILMEIAHDIQYALDQTSAAESRKVSPSPKRYKPVKTFREFVKDAGRTEEIMGKLHRLIGNKTNTDALKIIAEAMWIDLIDKPTAPSIRNEFPTITCSGTIFSRCLNDPRPTVPKELDKIKKKFENA